MRNEPSEKAQRKSKQASPENENRLARDNHSFGPRTHLVELMDVGVGVHRKRREVREGRQPLPNNVHGRHVPRRKLEAKTDLDIRENEKIEGEAGGSIG
jgi:hypothetical protein